MGLGYIGGFLAAASAALLGLPFFSELSSPLSQESSTDIVSPVFSSSSNQTFAWTGTFATTLCAPTGPKSCTGWQFGAQEDRHFLDPDFVPDQTAARLEWDASVGGLEELTFWIDAVTITPGDCDGCNKYRFRVLTKATGTSPIDLSVNDLALREGEQLAFLVRPTNQFADPFYAEFYAAQPFRVNGWVSGH